MAKARKEAAINRAPVKRDIVIRPLRDPFEDFLASRMKAQQEQADKARKSPLDAHRAGLSYQGPEMPDKGQKDGSCNRTACQMPLKGQMQWTMPSYGHGGTDGKYYYCRECTQKFNEADRDMGQPLRCTLVED